MSLWDSLQRILTIPFLEEQHDVEYRHSRVADIILIIVWETTTSYAECGQISIWWWIFTVIFIGHMRLLDIMYKQEGSMRL